MNQLDKRIQEALQTASELPESIDETTLLQDILDTFQGKHRGLMIITGIKMAVVAVLMLLCIFQFFQQETMMAMMAYATATVVFTVSYGCIFLFLWSQMNHNTTEREIKRLELQVALLIRELKNKHQ
jgi:phosphotransferase system  glucose/maltose/N-acetylglucosamine-specific IIC component